jgi:hypothetical protein
LYIGRTVDAFPTFTDYLERDTNFEFSSTHRLSLHKPNLDAGQWVVGVYGYQSDSYTIEAVVGDGDYEDDFDNGISSSDLGWVVWLVVALVMGGAAIICVVVFAVLLMRSRSAEPSAESEPPSSAEMKEVRSTEPHQSSRHRTTKDGYDQFDDERSENLADPSERSDFAQQGGVRTTADGFHELHNESRAN